jgi:uncharacterized membrane protein YsdA (DUF1294 family)
MWKNVNMNCEHKTKKERFRIPVSYFKLILVKVKVMSSIEITPIWRFSYEISKPFIHP